MQTVVIAGTGLIGASFGLALKSAGFWGRILGVSSKRSTDAALERGAIDEAAPLESALRVADLIYLAQPISLICEMLPRLAGRLKPGALVTDAGSTKRKIVSAAAALGEDFIGGHPMAGKTLRGAEAAEAGLFEGRPYILTPISERQAEDERVKELTGWIRKIGARVSLITPEEHDRLVAASSHAPQIVATALASALESGPEPEAVAAVSGPGLIDTTRLAASSYEIWKDILSTNSDEIVAILSRIEDQISSLRKDLLGITAEEHFKSGARFADRLKPPSRN